MPTSWGGTIASVENRKDETWLEIVARELGSSGRPRETDRSREHHCAGQHEVQRLHPAAGTVRQYAQRVSTEVEAFTHEALDDAETEIERAGDDAAGEKCARAR